MIPKKGTGRPKGSKYACTPDGTFFPCRKSQHSLIRAGISQWAKREGVKAVSRAVDGGIMGYLDDK